MSAGAMHHLAEDGLKAYSRPSGKKPKASRDLSSSSTRKVRCASWGCAQPRLRPSTNCPLRLRARAFWRARVPRAALSGVRATAQSVEAERFCGPALLAWRGGAAAGVRLYGGALRPLGTSDGSADGMRRAAQRERGAVLSAFRRQVTRALCAVQGDVGGKSEQEAGQGSFANAFSTRTASAQGFGGFKAFQKYGVGVGLTPASIRQRGDASTQK
jgi:hypothetical protein